MEENLKLTLNDLFKTVDAGNRASEIFRFNQYQDNLGGAAFFWMLLEIEAYTTLLTSRKCTNVKAWKTPWQAWKEFDVYFHIEAKGRSTPDFGLKTYVTFPESGKCLFKLEDWSAGIKGNINGRVVTNGGLFKCEEITVQTNPWIDDVEGWTRSRRQKG